jgi:hypothetical protein
MIEVFLIAYLGINIATAFFFYVVRYDVDYLLGGESDIKIRGIAFVGMLLFGTFVVVYLLIGNFKYVFCVISSDKSDLGLCSGMRTTNNFSDIMFSGEGD